MSALPPSEDGLFQDGSLINGRYEVRGVLGVGGTALIYDGFDTVIHRDVAIKVVRRGRLRHGDIEKVKATRVQREARAAARIDHPGVVTIYDMGMVHPTGEPFIVMEKLVGHNLHQELERRGPMAAPRALRLLRRCLDALAVGHREGLVHRDVKPGNIFLVQAGTPQEDVRVLDFGTASWSGWDERISRMGRILGTIGYLAPEYLEQQTVLPALDVYQMGLVLVEMLTGRPVLEGLTPADCVRAHLEGAIFVPESLLVSPLGLLLPLALARDPSMRFRDASLFSEALALVDPALVPTPTPDERRLRITPEATLAALHRYEAGQVSVWAPPASEELSSPTAIDSTLGLPTWLESIDEAAMEPTASLPPGILAPAPSRDFDPPTLLARRGPRHIEVAPTIADESLSPPSPGAMPDLFAHDSFFGAAAPGAEIDRALAGVEARSDHLSDDHPDHADTAVESTVVDSGPSLLARAAGAEPSDTIPSSDLFAGATPEPAAEPLRTRRHAAARPIEHTPPALRPEDDEPPGPEASTAVVASGRRAAMDTAQLPVHRPAGDSGPPEEPPPRAPIPAPQSSPGLWHRFRRWAVERDIEPGSVVFFGIGGLVTVAIVAWLAFGRSPTPPPERPSTPGAPVATDPSAEPSPAEPVDPEAEHDEPAEDEREVDTPPPPTSPGEEFTVTVRTAPPTSWVYLKGKQVGRTPFPITFTSPNDAEVHLMLRHVGFKDRYVKVGPGNRPGVKIKMRRR